MELDVDRICRRAELRLGELNWPSRSTDAIRRLRSSRTATRAGITDDQGADTFTRTGDARG